MRVLSWLLLGVWQWTQPLRCETKVYIQIAGVGVKLSEVPHFAATATWIRGALHPYMYFIKDQLG